MKRMVYYTLIILVVATEPCLTENLFNLTEKHSIPMYNGTRAKVSLQLELDQIVAKAVTMVVEVTYYLNLRWNDYRLVNKNSANPMNNFITLYGTDPEFEFVWRPDIYMVNEIPTGLLDFEPTDFIRIYENGTITMSTRFYKKDTRCLCIISAKYNLFRHIVTFYCRIRLFKVPMTHETCMLRFQSHSHSISEMDFSWFNGSPVIYSADFVSLVSEIRSTETSVCTGQGTNSLDRKPCISLTLNIDQIYKGFVVQVYLPSSAIVFMVWLGFWIHIREVSSRIRVLTVAFTAMVTQMVGVMIVFPDTVELKPLLMWNGFCLAMNLAAFVEFIVVHNLDLNYGLKRKQNQEIDIPDPLSTPKNNTTENGQTVKGTRKRIGNTSRRIQVEPMGEECANQRTKKSHCFEITPCKIDRICMFVYVFVFAIFNIIYWSIFMVD